MPIVNLDLTDEEAARIDVYAARAKRARKNEVSIRVMERISQLEEDDKKSTEKEDSP